MLQVLRTDNVQGTVNLYRDLTMFLQARLATMTAARGADVLPSERVFREACKDCHAQRDRSVSDVWLSMLCTVKGTTTSSC